MGSIPWTAEPRACKGNFKELCVKLKELPQAQGLFVDLMSLCTDLRSEYELKDIHCSIELYTSTRDDDDLPRAHGHICMKAKYARFIRIKHASRVVFRPNWPQKQSSEKDSIQTKNASVGAWCAYYFRMPKDGVIMSRGARKPFVHFRVNLDWIILYVQAGKALPEEAEIEISKT